jgi:hypothetical protein
MREDATMKKFLLALAIATALVNPVVAKDVEEGDYTGPFPTQKLYAMCAKNDSVSRDKCLLYIQGLIYGIRTAKSMQEKGLPVCVPPMTPDEGRVRILTFINGVTEGKPSNNKDAGDWVAFMAIAFGNAGNNCK